MADKRYDAVLYNFFENQGGAVVLISDDFNFKKVLQTTIFKEIGTKKNCFFARETVKAGLKDIQALFKARTECVVFLERMIHGRPSSDTIIAIKQLFPDIRIIVLVTETKRENIAYFYEIGVNNVISKPASVNNIIEKVAFTIKPQGKLSEYMGQGKQLLADGKLKEALAVSLKILKLKPNSPAGLMLKGDVFLRAGDRPKAIESYQAAHESSHLYLEPIKKLAEAYEGVDEEKRLQLLKKLDRLSPLNASRKTEIGAVHLTRKEMEKAEKYFDQAIETATKEAMTMVGSVAEKISETVANVSPQLSEKYLGKVIEAKGRHLSKSDITLFNKLGIALRNQGKWKEAIENYRRALTIAPEDEGLHYNMGMAYFDGRAKDEAVACVDRALKINATFFAHSENVSMNLGALYTDVGRPADAVQFFEAALAINPGNSLAKRKLAHTRQRLAEGE